MEPFDINKFRRAAAATDDAAKKVEEKREKPEGLTLDPEKLPEGGNTRDVPDAPSTPQEPATTSAKRRDPNKPPDSRGYQTGTPASGGGGAKGGAEAAAPAPEVVEETVSVTEDAAPLTREEQLAQAVKRQEQTLAEIAELRRAIADTPEARRRARAEAAVEGRKQSAVERAAFGVLKFPVGMAQTIADPFGDEKHLKVVKHLDEIQRQSTGGFTQEARPPAEPKTRAGEPLTTADSIKRLTDRINERKDRLVELNVSGDTADDLSPRDKAYIAEARQNRLASRTRDMSLAERQDRDDALEAFALLKEIEAMKTLKSELEARQAAEPE